MTIRTAISMIAMLVISVLAVVYMSTVGLPLGIDAKRKATMTIDDTNGLVVGSRVLLRGTDIGTVTRIVPDADGVAVDFEYDEARKIPQDSAFRVDTLSALGESYIAVAPAGESGPYLDDDEVITGDRVEVPSTINDLSKQLTRVLNLLDVENVQSIFNELDTGLPSGSRTIDTIERAGALTAAMLDATADSLDDVLRNAQRMLLDSSFIPPGLGGSARWILPFGRGFDNVMGAAVSLTEFAPLPEALVLGTGPLLANLQAFLDRSAADIQTLAVDVLPAAQASAASLRTVNLSILLDRALGATSAGDSVNVVVGDAPR